MNDPCCVCGETLPANHDKVACVWIHSNTGLKVAFAHIECTEDMEDITAKIQDEDAP